MRDAMKVELLGTLSRLYSQIFDWTRKGTMRMRQRIWGNILTVLLLVNLGISGDAIQSEPHPIVDSLPKGVDCVFQATLTVQGLRGRGNTRENPWPAQTKLVVTCDPTRGRFCEQMQDRVFAPDRTLPLNHTMYLDSSGGFNVLHEQARILQRGSGLRPRSSNLLKALGYTVIDTIGDTGDLLRRIASEPDVTLKTESRILEDKTCWLVSTEVAGSNRTECWYSGNDCKKLMRLRKLVKDRENSGKWYLYSEGVYGDHRTVEGCSIRVPHSITWTAYDLFTRPAEATDGGVIPAQYSYTIDRITFNPDLPDKWWEPDERLIHKIRDEKTQQYLPGPGRAWLTED